MKKNDIGAKDFDFKITFLAALESITWEQFRELSYSFQYCIENFNAFFNKEGKERTYSSLDSIVSWFKRIYEETGRFDYKEAINRIGTMIWNNTNDYEMVAKLATYATRGKSRDHLINIYKKKYKL